MDSPIDALRNRLREITPGTVPVVTVSLDLTPDSHGRPSAPIILNHAAERADESLQRREVVDSFNKDMEAVRASMDAALEQGARGYFYAGASEDGWRIELTSPHPLRNSLHVGELPWLFEVERAAYLESRPVSVVLCDLHTMEVVRIRYGHSEETAGVDYQEHALTRGRGRTNRSQSGMGGYGRAGAGGHTLDVVERSIEEHRQMFAREAGDRLHEFVGADDLIILSGVDEARSQILNQLPDAVRVRVRQMSQMKVGLESNEVARIATETAVEEQYRIADEEAQRWLDGAFGDGAVSGIEPIAEQLREGRVGRFIVHEDAVPHYGRAEDAREHQSPVDGEAIERLLRGAIETSADCLFTREPRVLEEHEGVLATLRW